MDTDTDKTNDKPRIFLVEDNPADARFIEEMLSERFRSRPVLETRETLDEAFEFLQNNSVDVVLLDLNLADSMGLQTFERFQEHNPDLPVIVLTGLADEALGREAVHQGAQDYLNKNEVNGALLARAIDYGIERKSIQERLRRWNALLEERVSQRTADLLETIEAKENEIRERGKAEEALAAEKERLVVTIRSIGDAVIATATDGRILLLNEKAEEYLGLTEEQAVHQPLQELAERVFPGHGLHIREIISWVTGTGDPYAWPDDIELGEQQATPTIVRLSGAPVKSRDNQMLGVVFVLRDMTADRQHEKELQHAEKLESLGILAGGISHDFNNILTAVSGNIELAQKHESADSQVQTYLTEAKQACRQATNLTQQLLTFAKGGSPVKRTADLEQLVREAARFASRGSNAKVEYSFPEDLWPVEVDHGQLSQVVNNLILNAVQAMPDGGVIRVSAENMEFAGTEADNKNSLCPGTYVKLAISDTGPGIEPKRLDQIFEPYFTTKHGGTGMGLASAYSIMHRHGGDLTVDSRLEQGSTFYAYVPAKPGSEVENMTEQRHVVEGEGRILIMDDDAAIRKLASELLSRCGYTVEEAPDGSEAVIKYKTAMADGRPYDLVVLDLTVPGGMGGVDAFEALRQVDSQVKAIVSSGYNDDPVMAHHQEYGFKAALEKPWDMHELSTTVSNIIEQSD